MDRAASLQLGPYVFHERLGEGGSGQVYRATGPTGEVAVKILGPAADLDDVARKRFAREIATLAKLEHPSLVRLLDHGFDDELGPYLVLPLLSGPTLRELVAGRALCPEAAVALARPIAEAAAALHAGGYVHRDLKPENAIAIPGSVTVIDLGLAWREGMTQHTESGTAVGSIGYMAPEQIEGRDVGPAADVYAIGVMIFEWIAGRRPFARPRATEEAAATLVGNAAPLTTIDRKVDDALAALVARCLDLDPARRPSAAGLVAALPAGDLAAVIADPAGYQAAIAAERATTLEREARAALSAGRPFAALALCDRGLAYVPDHRGLQELVATAEARPAAAVSAPVTTPGARPWLLPVILSVVIGAGAIAAITWAVLREPAREAPVRPQITSEISGEAPEEGAKLARGMMKMFDKALESPPEGAPAEPEPTTAAGWLALADRQAPADAVVSVRRALALQPTWQAARDKLCALLTELQDPAAPAACAP